MREKYFGVRDDYLMNEQINIQAKHREGINPASSDTESDVEEELTTTTQTLKKTVKELKYTNQKILEH